jgi:hypothetical protein
MTSRLSRSDATTAASVRSTPEALLLTAIPDSAPETCEINSEIWAFRDPRFPEAMSYSRSEYIDAEAAAALEAAELNGARPRLVCSTTPVAFITEFGHGPHARSARPTISAIIDSIVGASPFLSIDKRAFASTSLAIVVTASWEKSRTSAITSSV